MDVPALIDALSRPEAYPHVVDSVEVHQTHISVVFLAGEFAYKIKKPVNLGFLDFTSLEKRKHFCEEEVRLNRRLAPNVYLGVVGMSSSSLSKGDARVHIGPNGEVIEWTVHMKRLPTDATLENRVLRDDVTPRQIEALAKRVAEFHRTADASEDISSFGRSGIIAQNARENFVQAAPLVGATVSPAVFERVRGLTELHLDRLRPQMEARAARGVPRDTHGDLHLDHVYLFPNEAPPNDIVMVDCIEFCDRFRYADPIADIAFLVMDLAFHGRRDLARALADWYLLVTGDTEGRHLLPFYSAYRAVIRAKVKGMELNEPEIDETERADAALRARAHWLLALGELEQPSHRPALVLVAGLPGSGKSTLARSLAEHAGFQVHRSDVVRKELAVGFAGNIYTDEWTQRTYAELRRRAEELFWQGERVLIDANFRDDAERRRFLAAGRSWGVPVIFIHCTAAPEVLKSRLQSRKGDASDADWQTYQMLESTWQPLSPEVARVTFAVDTSGNLGDHVQRVQAHLRAQGLLE